MGRVRSGDGVGTGGVDLEAREAVGAIRRRMRRGPSGEARSIAATARVSVEPVVPVVMVLP